MSIGSRDVTKAFLLRTSRPVTTHEKSVGMRPTAIVELFEPLPDRADVEISLLTSDLNKLEREILLDSSSAMEDIELESLERDVDEFWLNDTAPSPLAPTDSS